MNAKEQIEQLAVLVAMDALDPKTSAENRLEALKVLNSHYTMLLKSKAKNEEPTGEFDFGQFSMEAPSGGPGKKVGSSSGRA